MAAYVVKPRLVTIVTSGHPSSCPRMVKAADAAVEAGYSVRFVSVDFADWAAALDPAVVSSRQWQWTRVPLRRAEHPWRSRWVSARHRGARHIAGAMTPARAGNYLATRAYARTHVELVDAILAAPFDFVYGGTVGALAATAEAARRTGRPFALDLEDYHLDENEDDGAELTHALAARVVRASACGASFVTTASVPMAERYGRSCGIRSIVVHNTVTRPQVLPDLGEVKGPLQLYWFSQTIGAGRGLEDVVAAVGEAGVEATLHLRGARGAEFASVLERSAQGRGARLAVVVHPPAPADEMVALCRQHMIGLSLEQPILINRDVCVTNKIMTYLAAGLAVIATSTEGHRYVAAHAAGAVACYPAGDVRTLACLLRRWDTDRESLAHARTASWRAADSRFHWEHPLERGVLLGAIAEALA